MAEVGADGVPPAVAGASDGAPAGALSGVAGNAATDLRDLREHNPLAAGLLPEVVHDSPAAVLLVDLERGDVVFANRLAAQLAPGMRLPLSIDDWSRAAGLQDIDGADLAGDNGDPHRRGRGQPLSRVAIGEPVMGEAVTAARSNSGFVRREPLWVVGLPLAEAPGPLGQQAIVVFLPLRHATAVAGAQDSASSLRDRAMLATGISITISDPHQPDNPLIWVNPAFLETTGYAATEVLGHNCRFLQGLGSDRAVVAQMRRAIEAEQPITTTLLNYKRDGTPFWNQVSMSPILDSSGVVTHFVGVQTDVSDRVETDAARERALTLAQDASGRLALLANTMNRLAASLDPDETVSSLADLLAPAIGDWTITYLFDDDHGSLSAAVHLPARTTVDPGSASTGGDASEGEVRTLTRLGSAVQPPDRDHPLARVLHGEQPWSRLGPDEVATLLEAFHDPSGRRPVVRDGVVVSLAARGSILGAIVVVSDAERSPYNIEDISVIVDVAARAGLAFDNARLFAREHRAAETLQRALLPRLPDIDRLDVSAEYLPATIRNAVGGDWYDVMRLREGERDGESVGIAIGDVMGHDLAAAAAMGQFRSVLRSYAFPGTSPARVLDQLDQLIQSLDTSALATCVYGRLTRPDPAGGAVFTWANAGHPPPLLIAPDGSTTILETTATRIIGVPFHDTDTPSRETPSRDTTGRDTTGREIPSRDTLPAAVPDPVRDEGCVEVPVGSTLLLYTDGLVESRDTGPDGGIAELRAFIADHAAGFDAGELVAALASRRRVTTREDDVAVLAVRIR